MSSDQKEKTKDQDGGASATPDAVAAKPKPETPEDLYSLDDLEKLIQQQDPNFKDSLGDLVTETGTADHLIELIDLDQLLAEEEARSLKSRLKRLWTKVRNFITGLRTSTWHFLRHDFPVLAKATLARAQVILGRVKEGLRQFGFKPLRYKLFVFAFMAMCAGLSAYFLMLVKGGVLPQREPLFVTSLESLSSQVWTYDPTTETEPLYDSVRAAQNILIIPKLVANLRRSVGSGPTPMVACEVYVEGDSPDVVVEIKDREVEFRDVLMRTLEGFSYAEMESPEGKQKLLVLMAREANRLLTKGRIKKVYFKTVILKP